MAAAEDILSPAEVAKITGKARAPEQAIAIVRLGVPFKFDGSQVHLLRGVAIAYDLIQPPAPPPPAPYVYEDLSPPGLVRWRQERAEWHARAEEADAQYRALVAADLPNKMLLALAAKRAIAAARRAAQRQQRPAWADLQAIRKVYEKAALLTQETGVLHHVDHEIPLRGATVSGLHVHQNLRPVPALDNMKKGNRFTP